MSRPRRLTAGLLGLALLLPGAAHARLVGARVDTAGAAPELVLEFDAPVAIATRREGQALLLSVDQPLDGAALDAAAGGLEGWVRELRYGYDTLLLALEAQVRAEARAEGAQVRVTLARAAPAAGAAPAGVDADDGSARRLARLRAQLRGELGDDLGSRAELEALRRSEPGDVRTTLLLAEREQRLGRWRRALALYDRALELSPGAAATVQAKAALLREHGTFLRFDHDLQDVRDGDRQHITRMDARLPAGARASVEVAVERRHVSAPFVQRSRGATGSFNGAVERAGIALRAATALGEVALGVHASAAGPGLSAQWTIAGNAGETTLSAWLERPYWEFLEGVVDGGTVSLLEVAHRRAVGERWQVSASAALLRYGVDGTRDAARSWRARAGAAYTLHPQAPYLALGYRLDTEHVLSRRTRVNDAGDPFSPLPVTSREIHTLELFVSHPLSDYLDVDVLAGYLVDRLNSRGPFAELVLRYEPLPSVEMGLRLAPGFTAARGGDSPVLRAGGYLLFRM